MNIETSKLDRVKNHIRSYSIKKDIDPIQLGLFLAAFFMLIMAVYGVFLSDFSKVAQDILINEKEKIAKELLLKQDELKQLSEDINKYSDSNQKLLERNKSLTTDKMTIEDNLKKEEIKLQNAQKTLSEYRENLETVIEEISHKDDEILQLSTQITEHETSLNTIKIDYRKAVFYMVCAEFRKRLEPYLENNFWAETLFSLNEWQASVNNKGGLHTSTIWYFSEGGHDLRRNHVTRRDNLNSSHLIKQTDPIVLSHKPDTPQYYIGDVKGYEDQLVRIAKNLKVKKNLKTGIDVLNEAIKTVIAGSNDKAMIAATNTIRSYFMAQIKDKKRPLQVPYWKKNWHIYPTNYSKHIKNAWRWYEASTYENWSYAFHFHG